MKFSCALFLGLCLSANTVLAAEKTAAVGSEGCGKLKGTTTAFVLVLAKDEKIPEAILQCAEDAHLSAASLSGLGSLQNPTLGYFSLKDEKYKYKKFEGVYELASLQGNLSLSDNEKFLHIHTVLNDKNYKAISGHLKDAKIGATAEITVLPLEGNLVRAYDDNVELNLISVQKK